MPGKGLGISFRPNVQSAFRDISNRPVHEGESPARNEKVKNFWKRSSVAAIHKFSKI